MNEIFKSPKDSEVAITELMIPSYANFSGKVHGGVLLSLMDKVAYASAAKHSGKYCVTVAVEGVEFLNPVEVGELVTLKAMVNYVGNTTMLVGIRVETLKPETGIVKHTNSCYFTMAAKNANGELTSVPGLTLQSVQEIRRFCEGRLIKESSVVKRNLIKSDLNDVPVEEMILSCYEDKCQINL